MQESFKMKVLTPGRNYDNFTKEADKVKSTYFIDIFKAMQKRRIKIKG